MSSVPEINVHRA